MLFAAILVSIGGGIRPCIASSTSRGSWPDLPGRTGAVCPDKMVLIAAHMSAKFCGASRTGFGHADNRHGTLTHMA